MIDKIIQVFTYILAYCMPIKKIRHTCRYLYNKKKCNMGDYSYIGKGYSIANKKHTVVGKYCSIAAQVYLGTTQHPTHTLTTHGFITSKESTRIGYLISMDEEDIVKFPADKCKPPIEIGNDVWIGLRSIIKDGVKIGDGAIIASASMVTKDVPAYAIVGGVPAKIIKYRFEQDVIDKLLDLRWWDYPTSFVRKLPFENIHECIRLLKENINLREEK